MPGADDAKRTRDVTSIVKGAKDPPANDARTSVRACWSRSSSTMCPSVGSETRTSSGSPVASTHRFVVPDTAPTEAVIGVNPPPVAAIAHPVAEATPPSVGAQVVPGLARTSAIAPSDCTARTATAVEVGTPSNGRVCSSTLSSIRANTPRVATFLTRTTPESPGPSPSRTRITGLARNDTPAPTVLYKPRAAPDTFAAVPAATPVRTRKCATATWTRAPRAVVPVGFALMALNDRLPRVLAVVAALLTGGARSVAAPWPTDRTSRTAGSKSIRRSYEPMVLAPVFT